MTTTPRGIRWARASRQRGHFCHDDSHAPSDYVFIEPKHVRRKGEADTEIVTKWACGRCWTKQDGSKE